VKEVVAVEGQKANVEKAEFVQGLLGVESVTFLCGDLSEFDITSLGKFDVVFCSGLLYHLPNPWRLMELCSTVAPALFLWTHYAPDSKATEVVAGYNVYIFPEVDMTHPWTGLQSESLWLTLGGLLTLLANCGYRMITLLEHRFDVPGGPAILLAAFKDSLIVAGRTPGSAGS
jgi:hypothetical protein